MQTEGGFPYIRFGFGLLYGEINRKRITTMNSLGWLLVCYRSICVGKDLGTKFHP